MQKNLKMQSQLRRLQETLSEAEKTPTDLTALETHEKVELNTHLSSYYPPDDIEIAPASKSQSSKTKS